LHGGWWSPIENDIIIHNSNPPPPLRQLFLLARENLKRINLWRRFLFWYYLHLYAGMIDLTDMMEEINKSLIIKDVR
jgi:hypothetical protein